MTLGRWRVGLAWPLLALSPLFAVAGFALGSPILLPILCIAPAYAAMAFLLRRGNRGEAIAAMLVWALLLAATMTLLCSALPERAGKVVIHGAAYRDEMSVWLEKGQGTESDPSRFVPQQILHITIFVLLSLATASLVSIAFGAVLMNYMACYVGRVVLLAPAHPLAAAVLAWHPWSVIRIASFVVLGVCLAEPLLARLGGRRWRFANARGWIAAAGAGLLLDMAMKAALAPHWPALLRSLR